MELKRFRAVAGYENCEVLAENRDQLYIEHPERRFWIDKKLIHDDSDCWEKGDFGLLKVRGQEVAE